MSGLIIGEFVGLGVLLLLSAFFSSAETALFSLSPMQIHRLRRHHPKATKRLEELLAAPADLLASILIGNTIVNVAVADLGFLVAEHFFPNYGEVIAIPTATLILIIFGELAPKRLGLRNPDSLAILYLPALIILIKIFAPVHILLGKITHSFQSHFAPHRSALTKAELLTAIDVGHEEGVLNKEERAMVDGIIRLEKLQAKDVMTPRVDLISLDIEDDPATFANICRKARFRFLPVCIGDLDHVKGFLDVAKYLMDSGKDISASLHPHFYVPDTAPLVTPISTFLSIIQKFFMFR